LSDHFQTLFKHGPAKLRVYEFPSVPGFLGLSGHCHMLSESAFSMH